MNKLCSPLTVSAQEKNVERQVQSCNCTKQRIVSGQHLVFTSQVPLTHKLQSPIHLGCQCSLHVYLTDELFD